MSYDGLNKYGIRRVKGEAVGFDADKKTLALADGTSLPYDRLILSPGIDFMLESLPGLATAEARNKVLAAWKAGPETVALRKQLVDMKDGGVYAIQIPKAPYRCRPVRMSAPVGWRGTSSKPSRSQGAYPRRQRRRGVQEGALHEGLERPVQGLVEYRNNQEIQDVDARTNTLKMSFGDDVKADVLLNVLPPMRAGNIATQNGLDNSNKRWCQIDWLTYESTAVKNVHILGDALQIAPPPCQSRATWRISMPRYARLL